MRWFLIQYMVPFGSLSLMVWPPWPMSCWVQFIISYGISLPVAKQQIFCSSTSIAPIRAMFSEWWEVLGFDLLLTYIVDCQKTKKCHSWSLVGIHISPPLLIWLKAIWQRRVQMWMLYNVLLSIGNKSRSDWSLGHKLTWESSESICLSISS